MFSEHFNIPLAATFLQLNKNFQGLSETIYGGIIRTLDQSDRKELTLKGKNIGDRQVVWLSKSSTLTTLDLSENQVGPEGARALAQNTALTTLNLANNKIGDRGALALASSPSLVTLDVANNGIKVQGCSALLLSEKLDSLSLNGNSMLLRSTQPHALRYYKGLALQVNFSWLDLRNTSCSPRGGYPGNFARSVKNFQK